MAQNEAAKRIPLLSAEDYFKHKAFASSELHSELWEGKIVSLASPGILHQQIAARLHAKIDRHIRSGQGSCTVLNAVDAKLSEDTVVVPDIMIVCDPKKMDALRVNGTPDLVMEIVSSDRRVDFYDKLALYQSVGVREYWIIDPKNQKTLVYFFEQSDFPAIYPFDTPIPVGIWQGKLSIIIAELT